MRHKIKEARLNWEVDSAGTSHYQTGNPPHALSQKVAQQHGIDLCEQCCRQFTKDDINKFDKIYVMDEENYRDVKKISKEFWDPAKVDFLVE